MRGSRKPQADDQLRRFYVIESGKLQSLTDLLPLQAIYVPDHARICVDGPVGRDDQELHGPPGCPLHQREDKMDQETHRG